ncbi:MAG: CAP domain-containing protein [Planctomycetaceae bacterium]|nr:CAP domain-containing protein [Planctomycetaceae bacterium]
MRSQLACFVGAALFLCLASTGLRADDKGDLLTQINVSRASMGMRPLNMNPILTRVAQDWSNYMATNNYFNHLSPDGTTPQQRAQQAGYKGNGGWENIAAGQNTAQETFNSWMNSDGHKANMLNRDLNEVGIGIATNGQGVKYWTMLAGIGSHSSTPPPVAQADWKDENTQFSGGPIMVTQQFIQNAAQNDPKRPGFKVEIRSGALRADREYTIETKSEQFNTYVRLENSLGEEVNGAQGNPNAKFTFRPPVNGTYRLVAGSANQGATGPFQLWLTSNPAN